MYCFGVFSQKQRGEARGESEQTPTIKELLYTDGGIERTMKIWGEEERRERDGDDVLSQEIVPSRNYGAQSTSGNETPNGPFTNAVIQYHSTDPLHRSTPSEVNTSDFRYR